MSLLSFFNDIVLFLAMRKSTIKLTKHELDFASDTIYPETKQSVITKLQELFDTCAQTFLQNTVYKHYTSSRQYKITKGEQYKQLPFVVLDYPQITGGEVVFVLRTMFWWGHYISCNMIIQTNLLHEKQDLRAIRNLSKTLVLTGENLWEQDLDSKYYMEIQKLTDEELEEWMHSRTFLKLSHKVPLTEHENLPTLADTIYTEWLNILSIKKGAY